MELPRPLTVEENELVTNFKTAAFHRASAVGMTDNWNIGSIAVEVGIDISEHPKEGVIIQAFWVALLAAMKANIDPSKLKYPTLESFLTAYNGYFDHHNPKEQAILWETANWMTELFALIPAKKNKGLTLAVIPKLVEGWMSKYVTGSGQTRATCDRVKIFETEGKVLPSHRNGSKVRQTKYVKKSHRDSIDDMGDDEAAAASLLPLKKRAMAEAGEVKRTKKRKALDLPPPAPVSATIPIFPNPFAVPYMGVAVDGLRVQAQWDGIDTPHAYTSTSSSALLSLASAASAASMSIPSHSNHIAPSSSSSSSSSMSVHSSSSLSEHTDREESGSECGEASWVARGGTWGVTNGHTDQDGDFIDLLTLLRNISRNVSAPELFRSLSTSSIASLPKFTLKHPMFTQQHPRGTSLESMLSLGEFEVGSSPKGEGIFGLEEEGGVTPLESFVRDLYAVEGSEAHEVPALISSM